MSDFVDCIFLKGIELFGYVGVFEEEKRKGQTFYIDIELGLDLKEAGKSDQLQHTVNYAEVFALAEQLMEEARFDLIESYAERLAEEVFRYFEPVREVRITVNKPEAPIEGKFSTAGVTILRKRDD